MKPKNKIKVLTRGVMRYQSPDSRAAGTHTHIIRGSQWGACRSWQEPYQQEGCILHCRQQKSQDDSVQGRRGRTGEAGDTGVAPNWPGNSEAGRGANGIGPQYQTHSRGPGEDSQGVVEQLQTNQGRRTV